MISLAGLGISYLLVELGYVFVFDLNLLDEVVSFFLGQF